MNESGAGRQLWRRRSALLAALAVAAGAGSVSACATPGRTAGREQTDLYVSLGRSRTLAVVDTVAGRIAARLDGFPSRWQSAAGELAVGAGGLLAALPLGRSGSTLGVVRQRRSLAPDRAAATLQEVFVGAAGDATIAGASGRAAHRTSRPNHALQVVADARGTAYVLTAEHIYRGASTIAVVSLAAGTVVRQFPISAQGETVLALAVDPEGRRLYASTWRPDSPDEPMASSVPPASLVQPSPGGTLVAIDLANGRVTGRTPLGDQVVARSLVYVHRPTYDAAPQTTPAGSDPGVGGAKLLALLTEPPQDDRNDGWKDMTGYCELAAFSVEDLLPEQVWPVGTCATNLAVDAGGRRAFILREQGSDWRRDLLALDLRSGATKTWPMPEMAAAMAVCRTNRLYVADLERDRLLVFDTATAAPLPPLDMGDAPVAVSTFPW